MLAGDHPRHGAVGALAGIVLVALGSCDRGGQEYPSRDWSGRYATRVVQSATDCYGAEGPPGMTGLIIDLEHYVNNRATVRMNPLIQLAGEFHGDRLEAQNFVQEPIALPDSIAARARAADSVETISYRFVGDFARQGFVGQYMVRAPDLRALVLEGQGKRCAYRYELAGQRIEEVSPAAAVPRSATRDVAPYQVPRP